MFKSSLTVFAGLLLSACAQMPSPAINVNIDAAQRLNPDSSMSSLPLRVKVYQLSDDTAFEEASFRQLWKNDRSTLGDSLLYKKELTLSPGQKYPLNMSPKRGANYIAVVGIFRRHDDLGWKALKPMPGNVNAIFKRINIKLTEHEVEIL